MNGVLNDLVTEAAAILDDTLIGAYLQGSFALGAGDEQSDGDFVVAIRRPLTARQELRIRSLHHDIPARPGHWTRHLEGSYAPADDLGDPTSIGRDWLFVDHGARVMEWSPHCNSEVARWILREHGVALVGPAARDLVASVPAEALRVSMRESVSTCLGEMLAWTNFDIAWSQRYAVTTLCRIVYTAEHGTVASKRDALDWAVATFDGRWAPLLSQVIDDRALGFDPETSPRPGSIEQTQAFDGYVREWVARPASSGSE